MSKFMPGLMVCKDAKANRYTVRATTDDIDRQGERVIPSGVTNIEQFLKTGSILIDHNWSVKAIIGKPLDAKVSDKELLIDIAFADTDLGQEVKYLYDEGFASTFSIGFKPEWKAFKIIEEVPTYLVWELLELSGVPVPANASATILRDAASRRGAPLTAIAKMLNAHEESGSEGSMPTGAASETAAGNRSASPLVGVANRYMNNKGGRLWKS